MFSSKIFVFLEVWLILSVNLHNCAIYGSCPSLCTCKWKGGKQAVECMERGLITVPESADPETQVLDISGNNIQILSGETFLRSGLINLQRLFLSRCRIGQIDRRAFAGLKNLVELDLSNNLLTAIPTATFEETPFLRELVLANNPIQKIDADAFKSLRALVKLDLSNCEIKVITSKAFVGIEELEFLKLNGNQLSEFRLNTIETLTKLHGVELHNNPWFCDCRLRSVKEWLIQHNIPYSVTPKCSGGPERLIDKSFSEIHLDDLACKPEILPVSRYAEVIAGENATITCRSNAIPPANIKWYLNGKLLLNNSHFSPQQKIYIMENGSQEKQSNLILTNVQEIDSNEFYCVAANRAGNSEANYTLRVSSRPLGITSLGNGQIAGLSAALVVLILVILIVILILLIRMRRHPYSETKTPSQIGVVTVINGSAINEKHSSNSSDTQQDNIKAMNFCNPVQKPPRTNDMQYSCNSYGGTGSIVTGSYVSPTNSYNNPDLINHEKQLDPAEDRPGSGEYSRNVDSLYPSSLWEDETDYNQTNPAFVFDDKPPTVLRINCVDEPSRSPDYPTDYGLPINDGAQTAGQVGLPANAKTLRVWQKGAVPVLPPVSALKRAFSGSSRNSPDEGYQEGCGTDV